MDQKRSWALDPRLLVRDHAVVPGRSAQGTVTLDPVDPMLVMLDPTTDRTGFHASYTGSPPACGTRAVLGHSRSSAGLVDPPGSRSTCREGQRGASTCPAGGHQGAGGQWGGPLAPSRAPQFAHPCALLLSPPKHPLMSHRDSPPACQQPPCPPLCPQPCAPPAPPRPSSTLSVLAPCLSSPLYPPSPSSLPPPVPLCPDPLVLCALQVQWPPRVSPHVPIPMPSSCPPRPHVHAHVSAHTRVSVSPCLFPLPLHPGPVPPPAPLSPR